MISIELWRARIGMFKPGSKRKMDSDQNQTSNTAVLIMLVVLNLNLLIMCGDVELNPGPSQKGSASSSPAITRQTSLRFGTEQPSPANRYEQPSLKDVLTAVKDLNVRFDSLEFKLDKFESTISELKTENEQLKSENLSLNKKMCDLAIKVDNLEGQSRRDNLIIHGVPETKDKLETWEDSERIIDSIFKDKMGLTNLRYERVHRLGRFSNSKIRPIIVKFTSYKDRSSVFSKKKMLKGSNIFINEDFTKRIQEIRAKLTQSKDVLQL